MAGGDQRNLAMEITSADTEFHCADETKMTAYLSRPKDSEKHPGIIVIHEAWGLNEQIRGVARRYAELGFVGFAPHLFFRHREIMTERNVEGAMKSMFAVPPEKRNDPAAIRDVAKSMSEDEKSWRYSSTGERPWRRRWPRTC